MSIDLAKRNALIRRYMPDDEFSAGTFVAVPVREFFDGNDDEASIAVNLHTDDHESNVARFERIRDTLLTIARRPDVYDARCVIADCPMPDEEADEDEWAYTDTVYVWTTMTLGRFKALTADRTRSTSSIRHRERVYPATCACCRSGGIEPMDPSAGYNRVVMKYDFDRTLLSFPMPAASDEARSTSGPRCCRTSSDCKSTSSRCCSRTSSGHRNARMGKRGTSRR